MPEIDSFSLVHESFPERIPDLVHLLEL